MLPSNPRLKTDVENARLRLALLPRLSRMALSGISQLRDRRDRG